MCVWLASQTAWRRILDIRGKKYFLPGETMCHFSGVWCHSLANSIKLMGG